MIKIIQKTRDQTAEWIAHKPSEEFSSKELLRSTPEGAWLIVHSEPFLLSPSPGQSILNTWSHGNQGQWYGIMGKLTKNYNDSSLQGMKYP